MKVKVDLKIILLLILFIFTAQIKIYSFFLFFILLHELAHIFMGVLMGMKISKLNINMFGFSAEMYKYDKNKKSIKIMTYLAGPIFNFLCAIFFYYINIDIELKLILVYINISLGCFNLLPILPLDGGRILKELLKYKLDNVKANEIVLKITKSLLIVFTFSYAILILKLKNLAILFLIIYLWSLYWKENKKLNTLKRAYDIIEKTKLEKICGKL